MAEILVILLIIGIAVSLPWISGWDPHLLLWGVTGILMLMALGMTIINLFQARRRNPRFLDGYTLGLVQIAVGAGLLGILIPTLGLRTETLLISLPFLAGGLVVLLARALS